jgi:hypothetical protein
MVAVAVIVVGGSSVLLARRRAVRVAPAVLTVDQARVVGVYKRLRRKLARAGADPRGKTAEELCQEIRHAGWGDVSPALEVIDAYNEIRFGARPLSGDRYGRLCNLVRSLHLSKPKAPRPPTLNPKP